MRILLLVSSTSIRVSEDLRERLKTRKRGDESYEDVIERLLDDDRDLLAGFGAWEETDRLDAFERVHEDHERRSKERIERLARNRDEDDENGERPRR
jgi:predicted CopG family antitoxin